VYPDGSVADSSAQMPAAEKGGDFSTQDILDCTSTTGTGYQSNTNCAIRGSNGVVTIGFKASYTLQQSTYDIITDYNTPSIVACVGGTCSDPGFTQVKLEEGATGDAGITMTTVFSTGDVGSISNILSLVVGHDRATTVFSPAGIGFQVDLSIRETIMHAPLFHAPTIPDEDLHALMGAVAFSWLEPLISLVLAVVAVVLLVRTWRAAARIEARLDAESKPKPTVRHDVDSTHRAS
jgi:hypothetical protein